MARRTLINRDEENPVREVERPTIGTPHVLLAATYGAAVSDYFAFLIFVVFICVGIQVSGLFSLVPAIASWRTRPPLVQGVGAVFTVAYGPELTGAWRLETQVRYGVMGLAVLAFPVFHYWKHRAAVRCARREERVEDNRRWWERLCSAIHNTCAVFTGAAISLAVAILTALLTYFLLVRCFGRS